MNTKQTSNVLTKIAVSALLMISAAGCSNFEKHFQCQDNSQMTFNSMSDEINLTKNGVTYHGTVNADTSITWIDATDVKLPSNIQGGGVAQQYILTGGSLGQVGTICSKQ